MSLIADHKVEFNKVIDHYQNELASLRTGRANPALIDNIMIEVYGSRLPIKQLASINVADARSMTIEPWDKNLLKEVEKAIAAANLGLGTANEGQHIRVTVPQMTEENRKELVKLLKDKAEHARINVRGLRDKIRETIVEQEKNNEITEDDKFKMQKDLDEVSAKYNERIKELTDAKEKEIMTV